MINNIVEIKQPSRNLKGSVAFEDKQGKWRLRLPRQIAQGAARYTFPQDLNQHQIT